MNEQNPFIGKRVQLLRPLGSVLHLGINPSNGSLIDSDGKTLEFGKDYLLLDGDSGENALRIYDQGMNLISEMGFSDGMDG
jgi:hypothetical protein